MNRRPAGAAALRLQAEIGESPERPVPARVEGGGRPSLLGLLGVGVALVVATTGLGVLPLWAAGPLDLGAAACYLVGLRSALPSPVRHSRRDYWLSGEMVESSAVPLTAVLGAALALQIDPGLPWLVLLPAWLALELGLTPWLDAESRAGAGPEWGPTALSILLVAVPAPLFVLALAPGVPSPLSALGMAAAAAAPTWRLVDLGESGADRTWARGLAVTLAVAVAGALSARVGASGAVLPAALLLGWYGLTGVCARPPGRPRLSAAGFVILAAALLAVTAPA